MNIFDAGKIKLERARYGGLKIKLENGRVVENVHCIPMFPFSDADNFISIVSRKGSEFEEIGIIKHFRKLPPDQQNLVREDIKFRYFVPEINDIKKMRVEDRLWECQVVTDRGEKTFYVRGRRENITIKDDGRIIITDIEKCRYKVTRYNKLPPKA